MLKVYRFKARLILLCSIGVFFIGLLGMTGGYWLSRLSADTQASISRIEQTSIALAGVGHVHNLYRDQIFSWKNLLLRGGNSEQQEKYWRQFQTQGLQVEQALARLNQMTSLPHDMRIQIQAVSREISHLNQRYQQTYEQGNLASLEAVQLLDRQVEGFEQAPTSSMLQLLVRINQQMTYALQQEQQNLLQQQSHAIQFFLVASVVGGMLVLLIAWRLGRGLWQQLGGEPEDASRLASLIANGDLSVDILARHHQPSSLFYSLHTMVGFFRHLITEATLSTEEVTAAAEQIAAAAQNLSHSAVHQSSRLEQSAASLEEISSIVALNADNAHVTEGMAIESAKLARAGEAQIRQAIQVNQEIAQKIAVVDEIAFQTHLLALNAALEANRAGESGRGFAIVANEIRTLASHSQEAAKAISVLVEKGLHESRAAGENFEQLMQPVQHTAELVQEIAAASLEQKTGVEQISQSVNVLTTVTQVTAEAADQLSATAVSMREKAHHLQKLIQRFRLPPKVVS